LSSNSSENNCRISSNWCRQNCWLSCIPLIDSPRRRDFNGASLKVVFWPRWRRQPLVSPANGQFFISTPASLHFVPFDNNQSSNNSLTPLRSVRKEYQQLVNVLPDRNNI
jgi:hypothetical protein